LAREAKVSESAAIAVAKRAVPKGEVASIELEREGGRLIYSMDVKTPGGSGIDEVNVDAKTGKQVGKVQHESATTEKAEAKAEKAEKGEKGEKGEAKKDMKKP
ncbi:MAG TPA: PepSY domain-containing protein, partial [Gemmatimonadaceae bacterium]